jgi:hypothetical protein
MTFAAAPPLSLLFVAALLAGCNSARAPEAPAATARSVTPSDFRLPDGSGCSGAIARYRAVMDNDLAMGHVNRGVYGQIAHEIGEADSACAAGQDARATALVHASKARHGYPG